MAGSGSSSLGISMETTRFGTSVPQSGQLLPELIHRFLLATSSSSPSDRLKTDPESSRSSHSGGYFLLPLFHQHEKTEECIDKDANFTFPCLIKAGRKHLNALCSTMQEWGIDPSEQIILNPAVKYIDFLFETSDDKIGEKNGMEITTPFDKTMIPANAVTVIMQSRRLYVLLGKELQDFSFAILSEMTIPTALKADQDALYTQRASTDTGEYWDALVRQNTEAYEKSIETMIPTEEVEAFAHYHLKADLPDEQGEKCEGEFKRWLLPDLMEEVSQWFPCESEGGSRKNYLGCASGEEDYHDVGKMMLPEDNKVSKKILYPFRFKGRIDGKEAATDTTDEVNWDEYRWYGCGKRIIIAGFIPLDFRVEGDKVEVVPIEDALTYRFRKGFPADEADTDIIIVGIWYVPEVALLLPYYQSVFSKIWEDHKILPEVKLRKQGDSDPFQTYREQARTRGLVSFGPKYAMPGRPSLEASAFTKAAEDIMNILRNMMDMEHDFLWVLGDDMVFLPRMLREEFQNIRMGFFSESATPTVLPYEIYQYVLTSVLCSDMVGFRTATEAKKFLRKCRQEDVATVPILGLEPHVYSIRPYLQFLRRWQGTERWVGITVQHGPSYVDFSPESWPATFQEDLERICRGLPPPEGVGMISSAQAYYDFYHAVPYRLSFEEFVQRMMQQGLFDWTELKQVGEPQGEESSSDSEEAEQTS